ncbi:MAG: DUF1236 domain-containing protein [Mesorhizobium sp.]|uniref:DUF1236 domain-containing protein n=1 Tax=Mesorhizobium sp. TaxID=1871066 RepID=UPI001223403A|nr:DUF1236 domain-containing protein [Mesorhizobium sp.]TIQ36216.1 MAG: DUF1236 domain-containing protein [Mesorhizobium sp.]
MKRVLITSMLALGVGCGAALAQSQQPADNQSDASANCAAGTTNCKKGGEQTQGKTGATTEQQTQGNTKTQTKEQAQGKTGNATDQQAQGNSGTTNEQQAQGKAGANCAAGMKNCKQGTGEQTQGTTTNQAQGKSQTQTNEQAQGKAGTATNQSAQGKAQTNEQTQGTTGTTTNQAQGKTSTQENPTTGSINNVTVEQKTQITDVIKQTKVEPVSNVDFDITVGVEVPRQKVRLHRLPSRIVKIVPAYEGYEYFVLADGRIVIVDPSTYKIVLVLT